MSLISTIPVSKTEHSNILNQVNGLVKLYVAKNLEEQFMKQTFEQWVAIANRLKKGGALIVQTEQQLRNAHQMSNHKVSELKTQLESLSNLFYLLTRMAGLYDLFFQSQLEEDDYRNYQRSILTILGV